QYGKDELRRVTLWTDHRRPAWRGSFRCALQLRKRPALSGCQVAQCHLVASVAGDFLPAFVKHPLFRKATTVSAASLIYSRTGVPPVPATPTNRPGGSNALVLRYGQARRRPCFGS